MYHIKGEIFFHKNNYMIFHSFKEDSIAKCNKKNDENNEQDFNSNLCYGSVFPCQKKDKDKLIIIPADKIMFGLIRVYYYRPTSLELFLDENKSYYFNFFEDFLINNNNKILEFFRQPIFKDISLNNKSLFSNHLGWYNIKYKKVLWPLFNEPINKFELKNICYSNFDKLIILNLFSNRSFNDLNQYPVFPMLYDVIGKKRIMEEPIGFQELTEESISRKQLIIDTYEYEVNHENEGNDHTEKFIFSLLYSNIIYTCNFLIRVYPYSIIAIEYQGDGFDDPHRLFFSIKSTFLNTLNQRSDLRELIPELFYFSALFSNINELKLNKLSNGHEIDNVIVQDWNEDKTQKFIFLKNMRNYLENEEKLNLWIDLIFGIKKEFNEKKQRYYDKNNNIEFCSNNKILNDSLLMQSYDFGVLPYQLLDSQFPEKTKIPSDIEESIYNFNIEQFKKEHYYCFRSEKESFICIGEQTINLEYIKILQQIKSEKNSNLLWYTPLDKASRWINRLLSWSGDQEENVNYDVKYLFIGDVLGNLTVYKKVQKQSLFMANNKEISEESFEKKISDEIYNKEYELIGSLHDHTEEIKYIDYNPRLNLVIDYALDGFINLYTIPTLKLIRVIQLKDLNIKIKLNHIALISNPFPMICCTSSKQIFVFDLNGEKINEIGIEEGNNINFCIDKNCGLFNDYVTYFQKGTIKKFDFIKGEVCK